MEDLAGEGRASSKVREEEVWRMRGWKGFSGVQWIECSLGCVSKTEYLTMVDYKQTMM